MLVDKNNLKLCNVIKGMVLTWIRENVDAEVEEYVAEWFTKSAFLRAYEYNIHPLNDSTLWPRMPDVHLILPPIRRRLPGRPCMKRKRDQAENELGGNTRHTLRMAGPSKARKKSNARNCPSQVGPSTPAPCAPTHVNQDPVNQEHVNEVPMNEVPINPDPVNLVPVNLVPMNLGVRVPKSLGFRARKLQRESTRYKSGSMFFKRMEKE
ncbi:unnamed protein product [Lactuca saligna]|uniref:Uncharacterized protein n=1 Tax=Lactuca saligna TaxID=75948 RepID=A0AA35Z285_LACSI|nr:unnamed protein product [Lactuca saligna]